MSTREVLLLSKECRIRSWVKHSGSFCVHPQNPVPYLLITSLQSHRESARLSASLRFLGPPPHAQAAFDTHPELHLFDVSLVMLDGVSPYHHLASSSSKLHILESSTHILMSTGRCEMWAKKYSCGNTVGTLILPHLVTRCNYHGRSYEVFDCHDVR